MPEKRSLLLAASVISIAAFSFTTSTPALAAYACWYKATNGTSWSIETLGTHNFKQSKACKRAKRKCKRKLKRAKRKKQISRGTVSPSCYKSGQKSGF